MSILDKLNEKIKQAAEQPKPEKPKLKTESEKLADKLAEKMVTMPVVEKPKREIGKPPYLLYQIERMMDKDKNINVQVEVNLDDMLDFTRRAFYQFLDSLIVDEQVAKPMLDVKKVRLISCTPADDKHDGKLILEVTASAEPLME